MPIFRTRSRMKVATTSLNSCLGIPVRYDQEALGISDSRGLWRWKEIVVGRAFLAFPPREQQAILLHEVGHCKLYHLEKRIARLWLLVIDPGALLTFCIEQEHEADRFARACGYGPDLARAFGRIKPSSDPLHPPVGERISRLVAAS